MLFFLIFIEGFIGLAYQMLFIRQLTPEVGASAVTSSWIIGFFLMALAIGYKKGGQEVEEPLVAFAKNMLKAAAVGGIGASSVVVMMFFSGTKYFIDVGTIPLLVLYCAVFVAPVAYWMGQSLPLLIQCSKWGDKTSEISGNALYLSTIGSFMGAIVTTNVFLYFIGATWSLTLVSVVAIATGIYLLKNAYVGTLIAGLVYLLNVNAASIYGMHSTPYADVYVKDSGEAKAFIANNTTMSSIKNGVSNSWYIKEFERFLSEKDGKTLDILVLGSGGFVSHLNDDKNKYTYVDIDPKLKEISEKEFIQQKVGHEFIAEDARRYLIDSNIKRDVIFLDAFSSRKAIPSHLITKEFFELVKSRIKPGGTLVVNTILDPKYQNNYSKRFHLTISNSFPYCNTTNNGQADWDWANVVYVCQNEEKEALYSDENNQNEIDFWKAN